MNTPALWVITEITDHLCVPHPQSGMPMLLGFLSKESLDRFAIENPQRNGLSAGIKAGDIPAAVRNWIYGGIEYVILDPSGPPETWIPEKIESLKKRFGPNLG